MNKSLLTLLLLLLGFSACKTAKKPKTDGNVSGDSATEVLLRKMASKEISAKSMDAKAKIDFRSPDMSASGTANIRFMENEGLWISVKKLGFEVARARVDADSVRILDRLNNEYSAYALDFLSKEYQLPADLKMIQQIVLGNLFFLSRRVTSTLQDGKYVLNDLGETRQAKFSIDASTYRLLQMDYSEPNANRALKLDLGDYKPSNDKQDFSYLRTLNLSSKETGNVLINIQFTQVELNVPTSMPFEVPARFNKKK
jgi:hypothetical protein